ncbi:MAG: hypothetical protein IGS39_10485 [Calothrix sp. C42_A2020_038]|nr:hypothetical protein [Calothrix sp. C42_A2020_038]
MDEIDKLLAEIKHEYAEAKPKSQHIHPVSIKPSVSSSGKSTFGVDKLLADVKADFEEKDLALSLQRKQELEAERVRQEELELKKLEVIKQKAKTWLEQLEPLSPEGLWFESFAQGYSSKLDAAIEYLGGIEF